ncbi:response regulator transcription factor [Paenibacillus ihbetae]|uniref:DNA-binding response regulator n=1 Tax=Paenibacillus ihbetae TaxID=1870820 RepID=A0ABX3JS14_9BACL|nr:helix-turn-helix domain-containing protein [Paenibacillus ihbetae]OOC58715.1 DNA-binding response regulator [Paenibacillus ihbetae]
MFKVLVADDHYTVLDYLSAGIPWTTLGLELAAVCSDGGEAWEACQIHRPDILVTDIGMPVMDGLELIEKARAANPRLKTVILSCHEDFHYAQMAVKLNVSEYILKESLRIEEVVSVLGRLTNQLTNENDLEHDRNQLQKKVQQHLSAIRSGLIRKFLEQPVWSEAEWANEFQNSGILLQDGIPYLPVLALPERAAELEVRFGGAVNMQFVIHNALQELVRVNGSFLFDLNERQYLLLFPFPHTLTRNLHEDVQGELQRVQQQMFQHLRIGISFIRGEVSRELLQLKKEIQKLLDAATFRFYTGERVYAKMLPLKTSEEDIFLHYSKALQDLKDCILAGDKTRISLAVREWKDLIESRVYPVEAVKCWVLKMTMELQLKYTVMQNFVTNFNTERLQRKIASIETLDHLLEWLQGFLEQKSVEIESLREQTVVRREIAEAQRYVRLHMGEKIAMEEMAHRLNLNPSHFSRIFKQETGETFVEFVTRTKMERAQELLNQSDLNVAEISEQLGYEHTSYFIKLFRNYAGMSPSEYRRSI